MKEIGRRYTRRKIIADGLEPLDNEIHHVFHGAVDRYKKWAVEYLEAHGIGAREIIESAKSDGWANDGAVLREHVSCIQGTENDAGISLAARIYELSRLVEISQTNPEDFRPGAIQQNIFELGRVSMLARVYGIDDEAVKERVRRAARSNTKFTEADRERWRALHKRELSQHSKRRAAEIIAQREGLASDVTETIRKAL